ncbi:uncharacterized protein LOC133334128 [Musca vetustissima]|uniref:uncharacterized protein LOC133334128 n=1 Tax=Musca vetustissima TaxID=27455 RepID=UPI002AB70F9E|nr:uncharacterized protein LOC133334128 [Musca vetustissima]
MFDTGWQCYLCPIPQLFIPFTILWYRQGRMQEVTARICNRTYYGDIGRTYSIKVPTPQWNKLPFLCHLTFTASGHDQGDIVQIIFDSFTVGRFDEGMVDTDVDGYETSLSPTGELPGCPEGFMQVSSNKQKRNETIKKCTTTI